MIHVAQIIPKLGFGGAERNLVDIINNSDTKKTRYSVIVFFDDNPLWSEVKNTKARLYVIRKKGKISWHLFGDLRRKLSELKPDITHTHLFGADFWGGVAAKKLGLPLVSTEENTVQDPGWSFLRTAIKRRMRARVDQYVALSESIKIFLQNAYKAESKKIEVINCGVDLERFSNIPKPAFSAPWKLAIIGRLTRQKGHVLAFEALSRLKEYDWTLEMLGGGELADLLRAEVKKQGIADRVTFTPPVRDVERVLKEKDVLLMPSLWEGLGIVAREAMAAGRLVVAADCDGLKETINDRRNGILFETGNSESLRQKLKWCFENSSEAAKIAARAKVFAKENFSARITAKKHEELYESLIEKHKFN